MTARINTQKVSPRQRGAALLTAMMIVTLVSTLAVSMIWQQWRAVQVEIAERARAQSAWVLSGALDWARMILREDLRTDRRKPPTIDWLGEVWAQPLAEARLSTFLAVDKNNTDDAPDAFLSGSITDAQAKFNVRNVVDAEGKIVAAQRDTLFRLCSTVDVAVDVAERLINGLRAVHGPSAPDPASSSAHDNEVADPPLTPLRVDQLVWLGVDVKAISRLSPYIVLLPETGTKVNLNTASREVIAAILKLNLGDAEQLVQTRQRKPFEALADSRLPQNNPAVNGGLISVTTEFFEVRARLRLDNRVLEQISLVRRVSNGSSNDPIQITPLTHEKVSARDNPG